ncbi:MAG: beta-N-acetylhexosaminidase [Limisphaerales bacterium]
MKLIRQPILPPLWRPILLCSLVMLPFGCGAAGHPPLLPRPRDARYGEGSLAVSGLAIRFAAPPSAEDTFAAQQLAAGLSAATETEVPIEPAKGGPAILLNRVGQAESVPGANDTAGPDSREAYSLEVKPEGAEVRAGSSAGLFYGVQTLLQMVEGRGRQAMLPVAAIQDWPAMAYRGFMMDFSHGQLLRVSEVERQLDLLARFKANQYYFYSEASIELEGYELANPDGRFTRDQVREVIDYARRRHIDVVPCLELYGHLHDLFRVEKFADLGLPRYGDEFDPRNPRVLAVIDDMIEQTARLFPSPWCHVGFDEPWSLGKIGTTPGKDPFHTFLDVLRHAAAQEQRHGKRLMFWADILSGAGTLSNHPELVGNLPAGAIAVPWVYDALTNYAPYLEPLAKSRVPTVVAPAVWNWNEVFPDYHRSFADINGLAATGKRYNSLGILNTGWTDSAQTLYRLSMPGLAFGAAAGWQAGAVDTNLFFADYAALTYPAAVAAEVAPALEELSTVEEMFERIMDAGTQHGFWADPLEPGRLARLEKHQAECRQARLLAESAEEHTLRALRIMPEEPTLPTLLLAARMFDYLGMKNLYAVEWAGYFRELKANPDPKLVDLYIGNQMNAQDHGMLADLVDAVSGLREPYRQAWLAESTPYRLGSALARWDAETEFWRVTWARVERLLHTRAKDQPFPSVDALRATR